MLTPASVATSARLRPGTRRCPTSGRPTSAGDSLARREIRNSRTSARLSMTSTLRAAATAWDALAVHLSSGTPTRAAAGVAWSHVERQHSPGGSTVTQTMDRTTRLDQPVRATVSLSAVVLGAVVLITAIAPLATDMYVPAFP